jgi:hypothetical protein
MSLLLSTTSRHSIILSTEQYAKLLNQLRAWCHQDRGRQQMLATRLGASKQTVSAWLNGSRMMSLNQYFEVLSAIEESGGPQFQKDNPMSIRTSNGRVRQTSDDDDEPLDHLTAEPNTLTDAREMIDALRAELKSKPAAAATTPASQVMLPTPTPKLAVREPALPATKPASPPASTFDPANPASWNGKPPAATTFPIGCSSPKMIREYIDGLSTEVLRSHLKGAPKNETEALQQKLTLHELQNRKSSR